MRGHTPERNKQARRPRQLRRREQRLDMLDRKLRALAQNPMLPLALLRVRVRGRRLARRAQLVDRQAALAPVELGDALDDRDRLLVAPAAHEEPRALLEREDEEADRPQEERHPAQREEQVPPAHVLCARARRRALGAGEVRDERPSELEEAHIVSSRVRELGQGTS